MKASTIKVMDNVTPFAVISLDSGIEIRQYWTGSKGMYGDQVLTVIFNYPNDVIDNKTSGCGYCKTSSGLEWALNELNIDLKNQREHSPISHSYYLGGNFYKVPKSHIKAVK